MEGVTDLVDAGVFGHRQLSRPVVKRVLFEEEADLVSRLQEVLVLGLKTYGKACFQVASQERQNWPSVWHLVVRSCGEDASVLLWVHLSDQPVAALLQTGHLRLCQEVLDDQETIVVELRDKTFTHYVKAAIRSR